jgi:hypothetical protein
VNGSDALQIAIDMSGLFGEQQVPQAKLMMEKMFGKDGKTSIYLAKRDANTVVGTYVSVERLAQWLKEGSAADRAFSREPQVAVTLGLLPKSAQWLGLWSPRGTFEFVKQTVTALQPGAEMQIPEFPVTAPVGFAARCSPGRIDAEMVVPSDLIEAVGRFVQHMRESPP